VARASGERTCGWGDGKTEGILSASDYDALKKSLPECSAFHRPDRLSEDESNGLNDKLSELENRLRILEETVR